MNAKRCTKLRELPESESESLRPHGLCDPRQNTGVGSLSLLQGIFPTQGSNPGLLHCRWILYQLRNKGSPRILEWVAYSFSSRSSQPRNQNRVSCIAGGFLTNSAIREASSENCEFNDYLKTKVSSLLNRRMITLPNV